MFMMGWLYHWDNNVTKGCDRAPSPRKDCPLSHFVILDIRDKGTHLLKGMSLFSLRVRYILAYACFNALILTPGPMVEAVTQLLMYWPFAAAGFAFWTASSSV